MEGCSGVNANYEFKNHNIKYIPQLSEVWLVA